MSGLSEVSRLFAQRAGDLEKAREIFLAESRNYVSSILGAAGRVRGDPWTAGRVRVDLPREIETAKGGALGNQSAVARVVVRFKKGTNFKAVAERSVLHLVIAWFVGEYDRVGHVARVERPCWFGRARPDAFPDPAVTFHQVRPGESVAAPHIDYHNLSRRQLELEPVDDGAAVRVRSVGLRKLFHNGTETTECVARAGDTLTLENTVVFLLEDRPTELPPVRFYPSPAFKFGRRDALGIVGESRAIWRLREEIARVAVTNHHVLLLGPSGAGKEIATEASRTTRTPAHPSGPACSAGPMGGPFSSTRSVIREVVSRVAASQPEVAARFLEGGAPKLDPALVERLLRHRFTVNVRELNRILLISIGETGREHRWPGGRHRRHGLERRWPGSEHRS